jgi:hypothetical protein
MTGQTVILSNRAVRQRAHALIDAAPEGAVVNIRAATRTSEQNDKMWALLSDVSRAKPEGRVLPPEIWKCIFMASVGHQCRFEPSLDGKGVVPIGFKSSRLNKAEFSDLIECILAYGAEHDVAWSDPAMALAA